MPVAIINFYRINPLDEDWFDSKVLATTPPLLAAAAFVSPRERLGGRGITLSLDLLRVGRSVAEDKQDVCAIPSRGARTPTD